MGYALEEIQGRKHAMFLEPGEAESAAYGRFWDSLRSGKEQTGEVARLAKGARKVCIEASYNPIRPHCDGTCALGATLPRSRGRLGRNPTGSA